MWAEPHSPLIMDMAKPVLTTITYHPCFRVLLCLSSKDSEFSTSWNIDDELPLDSTETLRPMIGELVAFDRPSPCTSFRLHRSRMTWKSMISKALIVCLFPSNVDHPNEGFRPHPVVINPLRNGRGKTCQQNEWQDEAFQNKKFGEGWDATNGNTRLFSPWNPRPVDARIALAPMKRF